MLYTSDGVKAEKLYFNKKYIFHFQLNYGEKVFYYKVLLVLSYKLSIWYGLNLNISKHLKPYNSDR